MVTARGRLIALEGPDGIGKTTLARALADASYEQACALGSGEPGRLVFVPRRQVCGTSDYARTIMQKLSDVLWHSGDSPDLPAAFWVGLQAAWYNALRTAVLEPLLTSGHDVIIDGWWFKFFSKLRLQGYAQGDLDVVFGTVSQPDAVVLLAADLGALYDRRQDFEPRELGMHAGHIELNRSSFISYQQDGLRFLKGYAVQFGWPVLHLDPTQSVCDTLGLLAPTIGDLLSTSCGGSET